MITQVRSITSGLYNNSLSGGVVGNAGIGMQLTDLNPGTAFVRADDNSLVASAVFYYNDVDYIASVGPDLYPDNFGKLDESRMIVNDSLYLNASIAGATVAADREIIVTVRIKCRIVKLATKDWMAIAIQSTASDN